MIVKYYIFIFLSSLLYWQKVWGGGGGALIQCSVGPGLTLIGMRGHFYPLVLLGLNFVS